MRIITNKLLNPNRRVIENYKQDFRTSDGPNNSAFISLSDLAIPCDSHYTSRIVLPAYTQNYYLNYGLLENVTFLLIKVTYNGNYDYPMEDSYDPYYYHEPNTYNINYYYEGNSGTTFPIGRLLILNGSFTNKLTKIYLNNPLDYDVVLDVFQADISAPIPIPPSSAVIISNLYYTDIITNQIICGSGMTGSTQFIIDEFSFNMTGYTIIQNFIPYYTILDIQKDIALKTIYLSTLSTFYKLKFLTEFDCNQAYSRILFAYSSYSDNSCKYLTTNCVYKNGSSIICSGYTGVNINPPIIYYNSPSTGSTWLGSGTTVPYNVFLHLGISGWTLDELKILFISGITDCFDDLTLSDVTFLLYKQGSIIPLSEITEAGVYNITIKVIDSASNITINYIVNINVNDAPPIIVYKPFITNSGLTGYTDSYTGATSAITSGIFIPSGFTFILEDFDGIINRIDIINNIVAYVYDIVDTINKYMLDILIADTSIVYIEVIEVGDYCVKISINDSGGNQVINYFLMRVV